MDEHDCNKRITVSSSILSGKPTIRGLRISVQQILLALSNKIPEAEILREYPELEPDDIQACLAYAAQRVGEDRIFAVGVQ